MLLPSSLIVNLLCPDVLLVASRPMICEGSNSFHVAIGRGICTSGEAHVKRNLQISVVPLIVSSSSASEASNFRGHLCVHSRYGLVTRSLPFDGCVNRLQDFGFPPPCYPSYRALAFTLAGLTPTEQTSLRWTHNRACSFPAHGFPIIFFQRLSLSLGLPV